MGLLRSGSEKDKDALGMSIYRARAAATSLTSAGPR